MPPSMAGADMPPRSMVADTPPSMAAVDSMPPSTAAVDTSDLEIGHLIWILPNSNQLLFLTSFRDF
jgi:hypothetical protein